MIRQPSTQTAVYGGSFTENFIENSVKATYEEANIDAFVGDYECAKQKRGELLLDGSTTLFVGSADTKIIGKVSTPNEVNIHNKLKSFSNQYNITSTPKIKSKQIEIVNNYKTVKESNWEKPGGKDLYPANTKELVSILFLSYHFSFSSRTIK